MKKERTLVFVDESGFYLLSACVRTYASRGQTSILPVGKQAMMIQEVAFRGPTIVRSLKLLLGQIPGKLLVIWDGLPAHHGQVVKAFLRAGGTERVHLERLPGYAPDLNPDESI